MRSQSTGVLSLALSLFFVGCSSTKTMPHLRMNSDVLFEPSDASLPPASAVGTQDPGDAAATGQGRLALKEQAKKDFLGVSWGVGPSITFDTGEDDRISSASLDDNGVVRVDDVNNTLVRVTIETHYFFQPKSAFLGMTPADRWGWGPFVAIQASETDVVDAIGFGLMIGWRYDEDTRSSFNVGLGVMFDPDAQVLGDGIEENQPLPPGETEIRYREESQAGVLLMFSFSF